MTLYKYSYFLFLGLLLFSCDRTTKAKVIVQDVRLAEVKDDGNEPPVPLPPAGLKVAAYLIYKDSTASTFDILNDKTIALWNTIIGEGDSGKPSRKTKMELTGKLDNLKVIVYNGNKRVKNEKLPNFSGTFAFIINDTGCDEVKIIVTRFDKVVYQEKIPFRCGE